MISWDPSPSLIDGSAPEGLAGYTLERKTEKGPWQKVNPEPITGTSHTDSGLQEGVNYSYRLKALRLVQGSLLESEASEEKDIVYTRILPSPGGSGSDRFFASPGGGITLAGDGRFDPQRISCLPEDQERTNPEEDYP